MISTRSLASALCLTLTLPVPSTAFAGAKFIHVQAALAKEDRPNPPSGEDEAARWHGHSDSVPKILRLQLPAAPVLSVPRVAYVDCPLSPPAQIGNVYDGMDAVTAGTFYGSPDHTFGSRIFYQKPAWDTSRLLPNYGWSERPSLWVSHIR